MLQINSMKKLLLVLLKCYIKSSKSLILFLWLKEILSKRLGFSKNCEGKISMYYCNRFHK